MIECPHCLDAEGFAIELEYVGMGEIESTGERLHLCPICGYEVRE